MTRLGSHSSPCEFAHPLRSSPPHHPARGAESRCTSNPHTLHAELDNLIPDVRCLCVAARRVHTFVRSSRVDVEVKRSLACEKAVIGHDRPIDRRRWIHEGYHCWPRGSTETQLIGGDNRQGRGRFVKGRPDLLVCSRRQRVGVMLCRAIAVSRSVEYSRLVGSLDVSCNPADPGWTATELTA